MIFAAAFGGSAAALLPRVAERFAAESFPLRVRVVLAGSAVAAVLAAKVGPSPLLPGYLLAAVLGLLLALIDLRCLRLPDPLVAALAVTAAGPLLLIRPERAGAALLAAGVVLAAYLVVALLPGRGLGLGDVKLAGALALILGFTGWPVVFTGLLFAHLIGAATAVVRRRTFAFGPALLVGALLALTAA